MYTNTQLQTHNATASHAIHPSTQPSLRGIHSKYTSPLAETLPPSTLSPLSSAADEGGGGGRWVGLHAPSRVIPTRNCVWLRPGDGQKMRRRFEMRKVGEAGDEREKREYEKLVIITPVASPLFPLPPSLPLPSSHPPLLQTGTHDLWSLTSSVECLSSPSLPLKQGPDLPLYGGWKGECVIWYHALTLRSSAFPGLLLAYDAAV